MVKKLALRVALSAYCGAGAYGRINAKSLRAAFGEYPYHDVESKKHYRREYCVKVVDTALFLSGSVSQPTGRHVKNNRE
jgi:hypothetical protein